MTLDMMLRFLRDWPINSRGGRVPWWPQGQYLKHGKRGFVIIRRDGTVADLDARAVGSDQWLTRDLGTCRVPFGWEEGINDLT